ncbi:hypothetical protein [Phenylobacterium sp. J367]|uniref:hypothetical protein n=1 Tax=Phenylobacterium sp. J367 TaxID=2898435 RepID=UPI002150A275|nr:hypothetical protein [Phenylobacterium sp. J367]MCR5879429.1 hypothetical protein [Phenylobacterium sp. J367]
MVQPTKPIGWDDVDRFSRPAATPKPPAAHRLTLEERVSLAKAPRRRPAPTGDTRLQVWSYDVPDRILREAVGVGIPKVLKGLSPDHMYELYDDGRDRFIYRAGPSRHGLHAEVTPAERSRDFNQGERLLYETTLPNVAAADAVGSARTHAAQIEGSGRPYLVFGSNSNAVIREHMNQRPGVSVGDRQTVGGRPPRF